MPTCAPAAGIGCAANRVALNDGDAGAIDDAEGDAGDDPPHAAKAKTPAESAAPITNLVIVQNLRGGV